MFLMGPTASGKTDAALRLTDAFDVHLVSVDSAQIYRGMDIGTAKPDRQTLEKYPHALIDILEPSQSYSAAGFRQDALQEIAKAHRLGKLPLLVGGTGLYFRALEYGLTELPQASVAIRDAIRNEAGSKGWPAMHAELQSIDPAAAARIDSKDPHRIQRALEVYRASGRSLSEWWQSDAQQGPLQSRLLKVAFAPQDRELRRKRIEERFHDMMRKGFLEEVRQLRARGDLDTGMPSMRAVGYRQLWAHLEGLVSLEEAIRLGIIASRQYAKRQMTWLRREQQVDWVNPLEPGAMDALERRVARLLEGVA